MSMNRREFLQVLAVAAAGGMSLHSDFALAEKGAAKMYDLPKFGNVSLLEGGIHPWQAADLPLVKGRG